MQTLLGKYINRKQYGQSMKLHELFKMLYAGSTNDLEMKEDLIDFWAFLTPFDPYGLPAFEAIYTLGDCMPMMKRLH